MIWLNGLSDEDKKEMYADICAAYQSGTIDEKDLRQQLGYLGYNATDIQEAEKFYRPEPPENDETDIS